MNKAKIGVIGGSALYSIEGLTDIKEVDIETPFGKPSDNITVGQLGGWGLPSCPGTVRGTASPRPRFPTGSISMP